MGAQVILASKSAARRAVLTGAGVPFEAVVAGVDEDAVKASMLAGGASPRDVADALAEIKAVKVSASRPGLVIGSDQTLEFEGRLYDKAETLDAARERLKTMRGKPHRLPLGYGLACPIRQINRVFHTALSSGDLCQSHEQ